MDSQTLEEIEALRKDMWNQVNKILDETEARIKEIKNRNGLSTK